MNKTFKIIIAIFTIISSWLLIGIGYTIKVGHPTNTMLFLGGIAGFCIGGIWLLILIVSTKNIN